MGEDLSDLMDRKLVPKAGVDRNCIQLSLSHREMKLHGTIKYGEGRTMHLANEQGMTYVQHRVFIYPVPESLQPSTHGNALFNLPSADTWHSDNFCYLLGLIFL